MNGDIIGDVRQFNRFYTGVLGLLDRSILDSEFSLAEARVLYELHKGGPRIAKALSEGLRIDKSYLSRMLRKLENKGFIRKLPSRSDGRTNDLTLTEKGTQVMHDLNMRSDRQISSLLHALTAEQREDIRASMETIQAQFAKAKTVSIRPYTAKDIPFVILEQIRLYELEYGLASDAWKTYVTDGVKQLTERFDSAKDCMLILEYAGQPAGCIAITHAGEQTAQLRFFFLDSAVRGQGLGGRLMELAVAFCREREYRHVFLWTFNRLHAARHLYMKHGFQLTQTRENNIWGQTLLEERWEMTLPKP